MQLDDVIATTTPDAARMQEAMERSVRWLDRCIDAHKYPERQNLFCIIQGGLDLDLRRRCCEEMVARDTPGIAIGGLSGGEAKAEYCKVYVFLSPFYVLWMCGWLMTYSVDTCTGLLPDSKPRYVMGVVSLRILHTQKKKKRILIHTGIPRRPRRLRRAGRGYV